VPGLAVPPVLALTAPPVLVLITPPVPALGAPPASVFEHAAPRRLTLTKASCARGDDPPIMRMAKAILVPMFSRSFASPVGSNRLRVCQPGVTYNVRRHHTSHENGCLPRPALRLQNEALAGKRPPIISESEREIARSIIAQAVGDISRPRRKRNHPDRFANLGIGTFLYNVASANAAIAGGMLIMNLVPIRLGVMETDGLQIWHSVRSLRGIARS
jgi:hypothetical protein